MKTECKQNQNKRITSAVRRKEAVAREILWLKEEKNQAPRGELGRQTRGNKVQLLHF